MLLFTEKKFDRKQNQFHRSCSSNLKSIVNRFLMNSYPKKYLFWYLSKFL